MHSGELEDWWKDQQEKTRGVRFDGAAEHFILAKPSKKDMSLYNVEGDAFKGQYYDLKDLDPLVAQDAKRDSAFAQFNRKQLELMRGLQKKASKEVRVGRKVYRPKVQAFMYDDQGRILAAKSQASGSGLRAFDNYKFPGGGIEEDVQKRHEKNCLKKQAMRQTGICSSLERLLLSIGTRSSGNRHVRKVEVVLLDNTNTTLQAPSVNVTPLF